VIEIELVFHLRLSRLRCFDYLFIMGVELRVKSRIRVNTVHVLMRVCSHRSNLGGRFIWIVVVDVVENAQAGVLLVRFSHIVLYFYKVTGFVSSTLIVFYSRHFCCRCCVAMLFFDK